MTDDDAICIHCSERPSTHEPFDGHLLCTRNGHQGLRFSPRPEWTPDAVEQYLAMPDFECEVCHYQVCNDYDLRHDDAVHDATRQAREEIRIIRAQLAAQLDAEHAR